MIYRGTWGMQPAPLGALRSRTRLLYLLHVLMDYFGISIVLRGYINWHCYYRRVEVTLVFDALVVCDYVTNF